jgi:hypothetical protein
MKRQGWLGVLVVLLGTLGLMEQGFGVVLPSGLVIERVDFDWVNTASWLGNGNYYAANGEYPTNTSASFYVDLGSVQTVTSFHLINAQYAVGWQNIKELEVHHSIGEGGTFIPSSSACYDTAEPVFVGIPGGAYNSDAGAVRSIPLTSPTTGRYFMFEVVSNGVDPYYLDQGDTAYFGDIRQIEAGTTLLPSGLIVKGIDSDWVNPASWLGNGNYYAANKEYPANTSASFYVDLGSVQTITSFHLINAPYAVGWQNIKELKVHHSNGGTFPPNSSACYDTVTPVFAGIPGGSYNSNAGAVRSIPLTSPTPGRYFMFEVVSNGVDPYYLVQNDAAYFGDIRQIEAGTTLLPSGLIVKGIDSDWVNPASWLGDGNYYAANGEYPVNTSASFYVDLGSVQAVTSFNLINTQYNIGWWNIKELKVHHSKDGTFTATSSACYDTAEPVFSGLPGGGYNSDAGTVRSIPLTSPTPGRYFMFEVVSNGIDPYYLDQGDTAYFGDISVIADIALNKTYTLDPGGNYSGCTDAGDTTQLTDGLYTQGQFWSQLSTVGWQNGENIIVTIDLASVQSISGVSFNTAAGSANVTWPDHIHIFVAGEDQQFYDIDDLVALSNTENGSPPVSGYAVHKYSTHSLQTWGRYMAIVFDAMPYYAFVDEIEVFSGNSIWVNSPRNGPAISNIREYLFGKEMTACVKQRIQSDIDAIRTKTNNSSISSSAKSYINSELDAVQVNIPTIEIPYSSTFRAILPLNVDHERLFKAQAYYWNALGSSGVRYWNSTLWGPLSHVGDPPSSNGASVSMDMMREEYRAGAFNLSNATQSPKSITMTITGLRGGTNPSYITVHDVTWTDTRDNQPVAAALPTIDPVSGSYPITLKPGLTKQIWLTFHPTSLSSGTYTGQIKLRGDVSINIPVTFQLRNYTFPSRPALSLGGFDYSNAFPSSLVNDGNKVAVLNHLKDHFVDAPWSTRFVMPYGTYDSQGNLVTNPSTAAFDSWIALWLDASRYYVFAGTGDYIGDSPNKFFRGTPEFNTAVGAWITFWAGHIQAMGLLPGQFNLEPVDEPSGNSSAVEDTIIAWTNAIHYANTGIKVWVNPVYTTLAGINESVVATCDILCPNRVIFLNNTSSYRDYFVQKQAQGKSLEFYSCNAPVRNLDPYSYYRLQAWTCWKYNAAAMHFWTFTQSPLISSWNEYVLKAGGDCTPFFIGPVSVTAAKYMEACREGIEDYEYFVILRGLVSQAIASGYALDPRTIQGQNLLATLPDQVLNAGTTTSYLWTDTAVNRTSADNARSQLLQSIMNVKVMLGL